MSPEGKIMTISVAVPVFMALMAAIIHLLN